MITAADAALNVINYHYTQYCLVEATVNETLPAMSGAIEFHSKSGFKSATFMPYTNSRFSSAKEKEIAKEIFENIFTEHGYTIEENDISRNILTIRW